MLIDIAVSSKLLSVNDIALLSASVPVRVSCAPEISFPETSVLLSCTVVKVGVADSD